MSYVSDYMKFGNGGRAHCTIVGTMTLNGSQLDTSKNLVLSAVGGTGGAPWPA